MFHPHMLILAAHVLLRATINPVIGAPRHIEATFRDMAACRLVASESVAAAPIDDVAFTCTKRFAA
jgi:hypothetical protein